MRELDVRVGLVVAQQDVEARLILLDQVVLERQRSFSLSTSMYSMSRASAISVPVLTSASLSSEK